MRMLEIEFTVEGVGKFPLDMLRRDGCFPKSESDSIIADSIGELRRVTLVRRCDNPRWIPTTGRWESFGWPCVGTLVVKK